ncbi:MAG: 3-deoxy-manno-octulosonate cytidylyltransferase [Planctomycetota bacterium]|jgi:3-deoxy-manno-octulosonate cytidylyltransferase (CMP-KDO synthetase)
MIPVRVESRRLPGKALLSESGQPLFLHTCQRALAAQCFDVVLVVTDSNEVVQAAEQAGVAAVLTSDRPRTGSERCAEALARLGDDVAYVVDVQGDWPEVDPQDLRRMVETLAAGGAPCVTLAARLEDPPKLQDPNVVKVVRDLSGRALYFSRSPIPHSRAQEPCPRLRHIGVYGFDRATLLSVPELPSGGLDRTEGLEQLRFLENGIAITVLDAQGDPWGIETREDYDAFLQREALRASKKTPS